MLDCNDLFLTAEQLHFTLFGIFEWFFFNISVVVEYFLIGCHRIFFRDKPFSAVIIKFNKVTKFSRFYFIFAIIWLKVRQISNTIQYWINYEKNEHQYTYTQLMNK